MNKKYTLVVLGLMFLTMIFILVEKTFTKENPPSENINTEVKKDLPEDKMGSVDTPDDTPPIVKGKLPADSLPPVDAKIIQDKTWVWQKTIMSDGTTVLPKKSEAFTLLLKSDGNASGKTDCNGFFGDYKIGSDGVISFGPLASTMMYCEGSQEQIYTNAINTSSRYMLDNTGNLVLLLQYDSGSVIFKKQ